jgi:hypothetical protein
MVAFLPTIVAQCALNLLYRLSAIQLAFAWSAPVIITAAMLAVAVPAEMVSLRQLITERR